MLVEIYSDGSARGNPDGPGGYGTILRYVDAKGEVHEKELSAGYDKTTNNRMELMGAIVGLEALNRPCDVEMFSDSQYVIKAFNDKWIDGWIKKGWKTAGNKPVKNVELWKRLLAAAEPHGPYDAEGRRPGGRRGAEAPQEAGVRQGVGIEEMK